MMKRTSLFGCITLSLLIPFTLFARPLSAVIDTSATTVTRSSFLSWSLEALSFTKNEGKCTLSYARYPRGLKATLCAAQEAGALDVFGQTKTYTLSQPITRGQALMVVTALLDKHETADVSAFQDVNDLTKDGVMNAIALKWMVPSKANMFGVARPLTGSEAFSFLGAVLGNTNPTQTIHVTIPASSNSATLPKRELMEAVWQIINRDYVHSDKIDSEEAAYKAIEALVNSLNDPYTTFFRPSVASDFQSQIKGELSGIGAQVESQSGAIIVVTPLPGSPAEKAGILPGDQIVEANGTVLTGLTIDKAVSYIRGEKGTYVTLKILRKKNPITIQVMRDAISIPEISVSWQGDIAVVKLVQFGDTTLNRIRSVFTDIAKKNPHGIILDLRNNGGGLLSAADTVVSSFVPRASVVAKVVGKNESTLEKTQEDAVVDPNTKMVVLVNKGSASASEITAGALQDYNRATIVGNVTFGKGTVQEVVGFRSGEAIKLTIAEWLTPLGRKIDGIGVKPDVVIDKTTERDEQMQKALEILR